MDNGSEDEDESGSANGNHKGGFSSDSDDDLLDNVGAKEESLHQANLDSSDAFDSLKEDTPAKKAPVKRKLGAKAEVVQAPSSKRSKKQISDSDDSPVKVTSVMN